MKQLVRRQCVATLSALGALCVSDAASADRVAVDGTPGSPVSICTAGTLCGTPTPLASANATLPTPFVANFGYGDFNSLYIYNNGLVSIGGPLASTTNFSTLANIAQDNPTLFVFTAGYIPGQTYSGGINTGFELQGPLNSAFANNGTPVVRVDYDNQLIEFSIYKFSSTKYELAFDYGDQSGFNLPFFPVNSYAGYAAGGKVFPLSAQDINDQVSVADGSGGFTYLFSASAVGAVPEPSTWAMLLLGFGGVGAALRRSRRAPVLAG